jgi:acetyl-CoA carboxylase carboxyltransferase component
MSIETKIRQMQEVKLALWQGGGKEKNEAQHNAGKLTARERIEKLVDANSFVEIDAFVKHRVADLGMQEMQVPGDGVVAGYAQINGRPVCLYSQDYTAFSGSMGEMHAKKIVKAYEMAIKLGCPIIAMTDSAGARMQEGLDAIAAYGSIYAASVKASGVVPQLSIILGPCVGGAALASVLSDFVFAVDGVSKLFINGAMVIEAQTGKAITEEALGGAKAMVSKNGTADFSFDDEVSCFVAIKKLMTYLPDNNLEMAEMMPCMDDLNRMAPSITASMPEDIEAGFDVKSIINQVVDAGEFFEVKADYATNMVVGFAQFNGKTTGIIANQTVCCSGSLDTTACKKAAGFIQKCDAFNIPVVTFTDVAGFVADAAEEKAGLAQDGGKLIYAYAQATIPKVTVIIRKAYGSASVAMGSKQLGADMVFAWPTAEVAVMNPAAAANMLYSENIKAAENPIAAREELTEQYRNAYCTPFAAASKGLIDDIIEPAATRPMIVSALDMLESKRESELAKKHGNMPL